MNSRHVLCGALAAAGLATFGSGTALAAQVRCGATITTTTRLTKDLTNCPGDGLVIGADNLTLDLNGHTIDGDALPGGAGIRLAGHHGVTLEGGAVREFETGVLLDTASGNHVRGLTVLRNDPGRGIDIDNGSNGNLVEGNTSTDNARSGIAVVSSAYNLVRDNVTRRNTLNGIALRSGTHNRIEGNVADGGGVALGLDDFSDDNVVTANLATGGG